MMDMELLESGAEYDALPRSYVIFICDFDPFDEKKYCYTFENRCLQDFSLDMDFLCCLLPQVLWRLIME